MDSCKNCATKFTLWTVLKSFLSNYKNITCPNCGAVHKHKLINRIFGAAFIAVSLAMANPLPVLRDFTLSGALKCLLIFLVCYIWLAGLASFWSRFKLVEAGDSKVTS